MTGDDPGRGPGGVGKPIEQLPAQPINTELGASQAVDDRRAAQHRAGDTSAPSVGASPVAAPFAPATSDGTAVPEKKAHGKGSGKPSNPPRSVAEITAEMDETRQRLAGTINDLQQAVSPRNLAQRQLDRVKSYYVDEYGAVRPERVAKTVGIVVGSIVVIKVTRRTIKAVFS